MGDTALGHTCSDHWRSGWLASNPSSIQDQVDVFHTPLPQEGLFLSARHSSLFYEEGTEPVKSSILFSIDQGLAWWALGSGCELKAFNSRRSQQGAKYYIASDSPN